MKKWCKIARVCRTLTLWQTRAEVNEPVYTPKQVNMIRQIGDGQPADEEARPALEPAADQARAQAPPK